MPGGNGMGPMGMGPMTGWGRGNCARPGTAGRSIGRGGGQGGRGRRNQFYATGLTGWQQNYPARPDIRPEDERALLKEQSEFLAGELETVRARLSELEKEQKKKKQK